MPRFHLVDGGVEQALRRGEARHRGFGATRASGHRVWEVAMLVQRRRLELDRDVMDWLSDAVALDGVEVLPLTMRLPFVRRASAAKLRRIRALAQPQALEGTEDAQPSRGKGPVALARLVREGHGR